MTKNVYVKEGRDTLPSPKKGTRSGSPPQCACTWVEYSRIGA